MDFNNTREMENVFSNFILNSIETTTKELRNTIQDEIDKNNIGTGLGNTYSTINNGNPTGEFREAWKYEKPYKVNSSEFIGEMHYDPSMIRTIDREHFTHGSNISSGYDIPSSLPFILFELGSYPLWGNNFSTVPRDAWGDFVAEIDGTFRNLMKKNFKVNGITVT